LRGFDSRRLHSRRKFGPTSSAVRLGVVESVSVKHQDGTIDSSQRANVVSGLSAPELERLYWEEIRRATLGAARFSRGAIRVAGLWPVLLRFGPLVDGRRSIAGGLFARRSGGTIGWHVDAEYTSVSVQRFAPLLRGPLWRVEAWFHTVVGRRFLARVARLAD
jgi:hypothetical protein